MIKKVLIYGMLFFVSFAGGYCFAIYRADGAIKELRTVSGELLGSMSEVEFFIAKSELETRIDALRHFVYSDRDATVFNDAIKKYIKETEKEIRAIEYRASNLSKADSKATLIKKIEEARKEVEELRFGYNF